MTHAASLLVTADRIRSFGAPPPDGADAVLVRDGRICAVGRAAELARQRPADRLDLPGTTLTPGLADAHIHLTEWALARLEVDLATADSPAAAARRVADHGGAGAWLRGRGWNPHRWSEPPHRALLDAAAGDRPVALQSHDMHALWVSSAALREAGIDARTPDPEGGRIVRDAAGSPTGLLLENAATLVTRRLPPPTLEDTIAAVLEGQAELHRMGVTAVHVLPGLAVPEPDTRDVLRMLRDDGRLRLRSLAHLPLAALDDAIRGGERSGAGDAWLRTGGVKLFLDGALGSLTAHMLAPYEGSDSRGVEVLPAHEFREITGRAARAGIATTVHAIGDAAVALALDVLAGLPAVAIPHRIEHVQCAPPGRLADAGRAGIVASVQPSHLMTDWPAVDRHWGARGARTYAFRSLLDGGAVLAFGSDAPVEPADPRLDLYAATTRTERGGAPAGGWHAAQCLTLEEAFRASTVGPAAAAGLAGALGEIVPGAAADLVAWTGDPLAAPGAALLELACAVTIIDGRVVHAVPGLALEEALAD